MKPRLPSLALLTILCLASTGFAQAIYNDGGIDGNDNAFFITGPNNPNFQGSVQDISQRFGILLWIVAHLSFLRFLATVEIGFFQICLALYDGKEAELADAFPHWSLGLKFLVGQIVFLLMVLIGLVLLVGPGVYLGIRYSLFGFCMADGEADLKDSFRRSAILTAGRWVNLSRIFAALLLLNVLGASLLGLGLFIAVPLSALVTAAIYRQLGAC